MIFENYGRLHCKNLGFVKIEGETFFLILRKTMEIERFKFI